MALVHLFNVITDNFEVAMIARQILLQPDDTSSQCVWKPLFFT